MWLYVLFVLVAIGLAIFIERRMSGKREFSERKIRWRLEFLKSKLPKQPTGAGSFYKLPKHLSDEVIKSNFSQESIQKISDHIGYFLGLLSRLKITIGVEGSEYMLAATGDEKKADQVGLYRVIGQEIQITKKFRFELKHVLAILAHEYTHHYLHQYGIVESEEQENEILTDIAAAYLGLGQLLVNGYEPITWETYHKGIETHYSIRIGYVSTGVIKKAIIISAELREWNPKEVVSSFSSISDKIVAYFRLWSYRKKEKKKEKKLDTFKKLILFLKEKLEKIQKNYKDISGQINNISKTVNPSSITIEDGKMFVEITNQISTGSIDLEIENLFKKIKEGRNLEEIVMKVNALNDKIARWKKLLEKYHKDS